VRPGSGIRMRIQLAPWIWIRIEILGWIWICMDECGSKTLSKPTENKMCEDRVHGACYLFEVVLGPGSFCLRQTARATRLLSWNFSRLLHSRVVSLLPCQGCVDDLVTWIFNHKLLFKIPIRYHMTQICFTS
jgi:hypothetical protein